MQFFGGKLVALVAFTLLASTQAAPISVQLLERQHALDAASRSPVSLLSTTDDVTASPPSNDWKRATASASSSDSLGAPEWKRDNEASSPNWKRDHTLSSPEWRRDDKGFSSPEWRRDDASSAPEWRRDQKLSGPEWRRDQKFSGPEWKRGSDSSSIEQGGDVAAVSSTGDTSSSSPEWKRDAVDA